jgi:hypothetical protein
MDDHVAVAIRPHLLTGVLRFVQAARLIDGVVRIALIGSLTTNKPSPKDADLLVTVQDNTDLAPLAAAGRKLKGYAQQQNRDADIFLCSAEGGYLGRTCHWKGSRPGRQLSCDARHCGRRLFSTMTCRQLCSPGRPSQRHHWCSGRKYMALSQRMWSDTYSMRCDQSVRRDPNRRPPHPLPQDPHNNPYPPLLK